MNVDLIDKLRDMLDAGQIASKDEEFAHSLVAQYYDRGSLSDRQLYWVGKLTDSETPDTRAKENLGDLSGVYQLFEIAINFIKYPKIKLATAAGDTVKLNRCGERSKYTGQINVSDGGGFDFGTWYGRIDENGEMVKSRDCTDEVVELLRKLAADPHRVAAEYGNRFSECCFCGLPLKDDRSVAAGYGPVCAKNYGLAEQWKHSVDQATVDPRPRKEV